MSNQSGAALEADIMAGFEEKKSHEETKTKVV